MYQVTPLEKYKLGYKSKNKKFLKTHDFQIFALYICIIYIK